jgi:hypothetical protein
VTAIQCPVCGWTGEPADLEGPDETTCPVCDEAIG